MDIEKIKTRLNCINDADGINRLNYDIWSEYSNEFGGEGHPMPGFISDIKKDTLLILGSNPSFNPKGYKKQLERSRDADIRELADVDKLEKFMKEKKKKENEIIDTINKVKRMDDCIGEHGHIYMKKINQYVLKELKLEKSEVMFWDVFSIRFNNQRELSNFLKVKPEYKKTQLLILLRIIELCKPKMILLPNSGAVTHLLSISNELDVDIIGELNETLGTELLTYNQVSCPIFLSANLHSRGQLDKYSRKRYIWHIKKVWKEINK